MATLLTKREIDGIRELFKMFDRDDKGVITENDARRAFSQWFKRFDKEKAMRRDSLRYIY